MNPFKQGTHVDKGEALVEPGGHDTFIKSEQNFPGGHTKHVNG